MTIEELWQEMEAESPANVAWLTRYARPETGEKVLVALEEVTRARALLVPVTKAMLPPRREWPECRGLELISVSFGAQLYLGVRLRDLACSDVFTTLAEDVVLRLVGEQDAAIGLLSRLRRWQQFLTAARDGLSVEAQRGLWGELQVLRSHLVAALGVAAAVEGWKASAAAHQDFQFPIGAVEVKTTAAKQPQSVRITSERQLDDTGVGSLFLHVVVVDEREVPASGNAPGQSLSALIAEVRSQLAADASTLATFNDRLFDRGWLDVYASRYEGRRWTVRGEHTFQVRPGFPRIVESELVVGVGDVNYAVSLAACSPFAVSVSDMLSVLSNLGTQSKPESSGSL